MSQSKILAPLVSLLCIFGTPAVHAFTGTPAAQSPTQTIEAKNLEQQVSNYNALIGQYGADKSPEIRERLADASLQMARIYATHNEYKNAVKVYRHIILEYAMDVRPMTKNIVAFSLNQIVKQSFFGHPTAKDIEDLRVLFTPFLKHSDPDIQLEAANSLISISNLKESTPDDIADNIRILRQVINSESRNPSPAMQKLVAQAMFFLGTNLNLVHKPAEANKIYRELVKKYAANTDQQTKDYVLFSKQILSGK